MVGQEDLRESLLIGLLADGHVLLESVPGLAKTTAARAIADPVHGGFQRIQCTPDLLPSDIIGTQVYESATNSFVTQLGPVHTNILLVDEINRSSAKTQSAMLEAMEERQTTIAGTVYPMIATQTRWTRKVPIRSRKRRPADSCSRRSCPTLSAEEVEVIARMDDKNYRSQPVIGLDDVPAVPRRPAGPTPIAP